VVNQARLLVNFSDFPGITSSVQINAPPLAGWVWKMNLPASSDNNYGPGVVVVEFRDTIARVIGQFYRTGYRAY